MEDMETVVNSVAVMKPVGAFQLFGSNLVNLNELLNLLLRFSVNGLVLAFIVLFVFYPKYKERSYVFTYILINVSVFLVCFLLSGIKLKMGFAFGLFAVFSIIRYRTEQMPIEQMTYLFIIIIVAVINALSDERVSYAELAATNIIIIFSVYVLERNWLRHNENVKKIRYEKIDLVRPENYEALFADVKKRTGLNVTKIQVQDLDFLNDSAILKIFYRE